MRYHGIGVGVVAVLAAGLWSGRAEEKPRAEPKGEAALIKHGEYLVNNVAGCTHCHTPHDEKGQPNASRNLQGATLSIKPKDEKAEWAGESPNITASGRARRWTEEEFGKFLTTGQNPHGQKPTPPMPVYKLKPEDARAVVLYLRSLNPKKTRD